MRAWLSVVRSRSGLLTTLIVSLLQCVKMNTLGILYKKDLDQAYNSFEHFYLNYHAKFLYSLFNTFIYPHKLFSMQLGPGTASLACARLIVSFAPFTSLAVLPFHCVQGYCGLWSNIRFLILQGICQILCFYIPYRYQSARVWFWFHSSFPIMHQEPGMIQEFHSFCV